MKIYHAVGNFQKRTAGGRNIKSSHIYVPLIDRLKAEGYPVELIVRARRAEHRGPVHQVQADIVVDMLTFGWFGANVREALMLGRPVVCYLRPEWLEQHAQAGAGLHRRAAGRERYAGDRRGRAQGARRGPGAAP